MMTRNPDGHGLEHPLVREYLARLRRESTRLASDQAHDLYADIADHLRVALGDQPSEEQVREQLDRVGSPALLVDEAGGLAAPARPRTRAVAVGAVMLLVLAELLIFLPTLAAVLWVAGLVLLAVPKEWTGPQKLRGYLSLGTGLPVVFIALSAGFVGASTSCSAGSEVRPDGTLIQTPMVCTETSGAPWLAILAVTLLIGYVGWQFLTVRRLLRNPVP